MLKIEIKKNVPSGTIYFYWDFKKNVAAAAYFMLGKGLRNHTLVINGREYPWNDAYWTGWHNRRYTDVLEEHIKECIELDETFYG